LTRGDVEVKITGGNTVAFYGDCNHLIVLKIVSRKKGKIIYDGPGAPVLAIAGKEQKNGQRRVALSKIEALAVEQANRR
jgi:hypothetical protein